MDVMDLLTGDEYDKILADLKTYLPFLRNIIDNAKELNIQNAHLDKLRSLYEMVDQKKLPTAKLKSCQSVIDNLYNKYCEEIDALVVKNNSKKHQLNEGENKTKSSEAELPSNKSDQTQNTKSELSKISTLSSFTNQTHNEQLGNLKHNEKQNVESIYEKCPDNSIYDKPSSSNINCNNDTMLIKDNLPEFSNSRLRLNKFIALATNAAFEKLDSTDTTEKVSESTIKELAKQVYDGLVKQKTDDMLKGVDLQSVDLDTIKQALDHFKKSSINDGPVQPPPLPPADLIDLGATPIEITPSLKSIHDCVSTHNNIISKPETKPFLSLTSNKPSIREKLNNEVNVLHKIGPTNEPKQMFISVLKPGTLLDLQNSETTRTSLHIESFKPVTKFNEKISYKPSIADISVPRDPRIRKKSLLNSDIGSVNSIQSIQKNLNPMNNLSPTNFTLQQELQQSSLPDYTNDTACFRNPLCHSSKQPVNKQFSTELDINSIHSQSINSCQLTQNHYNLSHNDLNFDTQKNDFNQYSSQMHVNPIQHINPMIKSCESVLYKCHNDNISKRDPRSTKINHRTVGHQYRNFKEFREAKYGKEKHSNSGPGKTLRTMNRNRAHNSNYSYSRENEKLKNIDKTKNTATIYPFNSFGIINESTSIKSFKIPKIKSKEIVDSNVRNDVKNDNKEKDLKTEIKLVENSPEKLITNNIVNKDDIINTETILNISSKESVSHVNKDDMINTQTILNTSSKESVSQSVKPKKPKKYSKEKEFEKIVKEAVLNSNDGIFGPRTRTRSSLKKKEDTQNKPDLISYQKTNNFIDNDINKTDLVLENHCPKSNQNLEIVNELIETKQNVIPSTSKETFEIESSTVNKSKSEEEVSSNEINSTTEITSNSKIDEKVLINILANPKLLSVINILQDENKLEKLNKLLENPEVVKINDDKSKSKNILLDREYSNTDEQRKIRKRLKKEKKRKRKKKNFSSECLSQDESINDKISHMTDDNDLNNDDEVNVKNINDLNNLNDNENTSSGDDYNSVSSVQIQSKSSKRKKRNPHYEILRSKSCENELKDLKIVISKFDKNIKRNQCLDFEKKANNVQTVSEHKNEEIQKCKRNKPFLGPLCVKLARQKIELGDQSITELDERSQIKCIATNESIINDRVNQDPELVMSIEKDLVNSGTLNTVHRPYVLLQPCQSAPTKSSLTAVESESTSKEDQLCEIDQSSNRNEMTLTVPNAIVNKSDSKKIRPKMTELEKLHADISECYGYESVLFAPNIRHCRTNKQIDYMNSNSTNNAVLSKKSKISNVERIDTSDEFIHEKPKLKASKNCKNSSLQLNKKINLTKKNNNMQNVEENITTSRNRNFIQSKKKLKLKKRKHKLSQRVKNNINIDASENVQLVNVSDYASISETAASKILNKNELVDKNYFQAGNYSLSCKFCRFTAEGLNIVCHYKRYHSEEEVLPSRLSKVWAEKLINESLKENYGFLNSTQVEDSKSSKHIIPLIFQCVFCETTFLGITDFYDHMTGHTGEYRYRCKICKLDFLYERNVITHITAHPNHSKTEKNYCILYPNPIQNKEIFGYLCPFCYFIQLDYNNIVKHMTMRHFDEDKKCNGYWTVIRINLDTSSINEFDGPAIDYDNLHGCLPPSQIEKHVQQDISPTIFESTNNIQKSKSSKSDLTVQVENSSQVDPVSIKQEINEKSSECTISNILELPKLTDFTLKDEFGTSIPDYKIEIGEYALKNGTECVLGGLSCEQINNSVLLYKCTVSACFQNQYSTVFFKDFYKHIEISHQFTVWDGMCHACKHKIEMISEQHFLKDALQHLISHHLVLKKNENHDLFNTINLNEQKNVTTQFENTIQNTNEEKAVQKLRVRHLPGDVLSSIKIRDVSEQKVINDLPIYKSNNDENSSNNTKVEQNNINEVPDKDISSKLSLSIAQTISLEKKKIMKTSEIQSNKNKLFENDDLKKLKNVKTLCEVVLPNSVVYLAPGQQIVNKGNTLESTYCLIDTDYKKCYSKKVKDLPLKVMKTQFAFDGMMSLPRSLGLYKCCNRHCTKIFNDKELFKLHIKLHYSKAKRNKKNQSSIAELFKNCIYCFKVFDDEDSLANHIAEKYSFCVYFCTKCFYRAYTASHVLVHQLIIHNMSKPSIIQLEHDENVSEIPKEILMVVDFNEFVLPYVCNMGCCNFHCYLADDFLSHLNQEHQQCDMFFCYLCAKNSINEDFFELEPKSLIEHFAYHNINMYQCIFCLFGTEVMDLMINHLSMEHFEYEPLCLERSPKSDICDAKNIENLKILRLQKAIDNGVVQVVNLPRETSSLSETLPQSTQSRSLECPDLLAHVDENNKPSDTIIITVPDKNQMENNSSSTPAIDHEFIMLDDINESNLKDNMKINNIWSTTNNSEKNMEIRHSDIIVINDDDDDDLGDFGKSKNIESSKRKSIEESITESKEQKFKRLALPLIALEKLFTCIDCNEVFSSSVDYQKHLLHCPFWNKNGKRCPYCVKTFKTVLNLTEHIKLHGPNRFRCSMCNLSLPSHRAIQYHMKTLHNVHNFDYVPSNPDLIDHEKDEFIVYEDETLSQKKHKQNTGYTCAECSFICTNRKIIVSHLKNAHKIYEYDFSLINPPTNIEFNLEYQVKSTKPIHNSKPNQQQKTNLKRKRSIDHTNNVAKKKELPKINDIQEKPKCLLFSPNTIENIPKLHIFSESIGCLLCQYTTKVRSNLLIHLNGHKKGQDNTTKEIVNPVPSIGKSDLHFNKSFNLSASSFDAMNFEKNKIEEINKKIVEVALPDNYNIEIFPQFIPLNKRFNCSASCGYTSMSEELLTKHISILHSDYQNYICPHCTSRSITSKFVNLDKIGFHLMHHGDNLYKCQYCDYIHFNQDEIKAHMRCVHLSEITSQNKSNIFIVRKLMIKDQSSGVQSTATEWVCNMCTSGIIYTENDVRAHVSVVHKMSCMFKCPMCLFEHNDDNAKIFEDHFKSKHPSVAVKISRIYEKVIDVKQLCNKSNTNGMLLNSEYTQELQALESIEPAIMPPTCRGIPVEPIAINKTPSKSRGLLKSPLKISRQSIQSHKQKLISNMFSKDDSMGTISSNGHFVCPRCNNFETSNVHHFSEHLEKEIYYKTWKCIECFEISDSPKKMAWHVKKHASGSKYEKIEDPEKLEWVKRVIDHQKCLLSELEKIKKEQIEKEFKQNETIITEKKLSKYPSKDKIKGNVKSGKNVCSPEFIYQYTDEIINLDDSE